MVEQKLFFSTFSLFIILILNAIFPWFVSNSCTLLIKLFVANNYLCIRFKFICFCIPQSKLLCNESQNNFVALIFFLIFHSSSRSLCHFIRMSFRLLNHRINIDFELNLNHPRFNIYTTHRIGEKRDREKEIKNGNRPWDNKWIEITNETIWFIAWIL